MSMYVISLCPAILDGVIKRFRQPQRIAPAPQVPLAVVQRAFEEQPVIRTIRPSNGISDSVAIFSRNYADATVWPDAALSGLVQDPKFPESLKGPIRNEIACRRVQKAAAIPTPQTLPSSMDYSWVSDTDLFERLGNSAVPLAERAEIVAELQRRRLVS